MNPRTFRETVIQYLDTIQPNSEEEAPSSEDEKDSFYAESSETSSNYEDDDSESEDEDKYEDEIPYYLLRYTAKPGLTGWAQLADIDHRKADGPKLRLQYDLFYIKNRSILFELLIITKTIRYLFLGKGV